MIFSFFIYLIGGVLAGLSAGLLGVGGGLVVVPFLAFILPYNGFPPDYIMHVAVTTSLMIVVGTSISSIIAHHKKGGILWDLFWKMLAGLVVGAIVAAFIADSVSSDFLEGGFAIFTFIMAFNILFSQKNEMKDPKIPGRLILTVASFFISGVCNLLGLGGGSLMVPFLSRIGVSMKNSVATSALCGLPIALVGVICLTYLGLHQKITVPPYTTGFIYWPACIAMMIPSILVAPIGATWAHQLSSRWLEKIFSVFLILVGVDMISHIRW